MRILNSILIVLLFFIAIDASAQKVKWGKLHKSKSKYYDPNIVGEDEKYFYGYDFYKKKIIVEAISKKDYSVKYSKEIELPEVNGKKSDFEQMSFVDDQFLLFYSFYDKKADQSQVFVTSIKSSNGAISNKSTDLFAIEVEKKRRSGEFTVLSSDDGTRILINHYGYYKKQQEYSDKYWLLDGELEEITNKEVTYEKGSGFVLSNLRMDSQGSIYMMKRNDDGMFLMSFDALRDYEAWEEEIEVEFEDTHASVMDITLGINKKDDLVLIGSYITSDLKEKKRKTKVKDTQLGGAFYLRMDHVSKEIVVSKISKFDQDFLDQFATAKQLAKDKKKKDEAEADIDHIKFFFEEDGSTVFVGEYYTYVRYTDQNGSTVGESFQYMDAVAMRFTEDGTLTWAHKIPKRQIFSWSNFYLGFITHSNGMSFMTIPYYYKDFYSYTATIMNGKVYIAYNDNVKNTPIKSVNEKHKIASKLKSTVVTVYSIDLETGEKEKEVAQKLSNQGLYFKTSFSYQKDTSSPLLIMGQKKKKFMYGEATF